MEEDRPVGPRYELIEMEEHTSKKFLISKSADFYEWAGNYLGERTRKAAIAEARRSAAPTRWGFLAAAMIQDIARANKAALSIPGMSAVKELVESVARAGDLARLQFASASEELWRSARMASLTALSPWLSEASSVEDGSRAEDKGIVRGDAASDQGDAVSDDKATERED